VAGSARSTPPLLPPEEVQGAEASAPSRPASPSPGSGPREASLGRGLHGGPFLPHPLPGGEVAGAPVKGEEGERPPPLPFSISASGEERQGGRNLSPQGPQHPFGGKALAREEVGEAAQEVFLRLLRVLEPVCGPGQV